MNKKNLLQLCALGVLVFIGWSLSGKGRASSEDHNPHRRTTRARSATHDVPPAAPRPTEPPEWTALYNSYMEGLSELARKSPQASEINRLFRQAAIRCFRDEYNNCVSTERRPGFLVTVDESLSPNTFALYRPDSDILIINAKRRLSSLAGGLVLAHEFKHAMDDNNDRIRLNPNNPRDKAVGESQAFRLQEQILNEYTGGEYRHINMRLIELMELAEEGGHVDMGEEYRNLLALLPAPKAGEEPFPLGILHTWMVLGYYNRISASREEFISRAATLFSS